MKSKLYNWKRFWCPGTGAFTLDEDGYLRDPDSEYGDFLNPEAVPFESIAKTPCLLLLGEPGMGKSTAMQKERTSIDTNIKAGGGRSIWKNLNEYGEEGRLIRDLFESRLFIDPLKAKQPLHIFLDSLDECLLRIDTLIPILLNKFKNFPLQLIYLRIACRTANLPIGLEEGLKKIWGQDKVKAFELLPLRKIDVIAASDSDGIESGAFLKEVDQKGVVPFAIKPITLNFLLNNYAMHGSLPSDQWKLYSEGCSWLCEEKSISRRDAGLTGELTVEQRLIIAARIATVTTLTNRSACWIGTRDVGIHEEDLPIWEIWQGKEKIDGDQFEVDERSIREVLDTGLFSGRGPNRIGWAHHTYAEFLTAYYILHHDISISKIENFLIHPDDSNKKIVPQLNGVAAWLAYKKDTIFKMIMESEPDLLLQSSTALSNESARSQLVEYIIKSYREGNISLRLSYNHRRYSKLCHPQLDDQVKKIINDQAEKEKVRNAAIDIAEACKLQTIQNDLLTIVLNPNEPYNVRENAVYAIKRIADDDVKIQLFPLATQKNTDDPMDQLKGCSLSALWPKHISVDQLFLSLTPPKEHFYAGAYQIFIGQEITKKLKIEDLPVALKWIGSLPRMHSVCFAFGNLADEIIMKAWNYLDISEIREAFAAIVLSRLNHFDGIIRRDNIAKFRQLINREDDKRHLLIETLVPMVSKTAEGVRSLSYSRTSIILDKDIPWLINKLKTKKEKQLQYIWESLVVNSFRWQNPNHLRDILRGRRYHKFLAKSFPMMKVIIAIYLPFIFRFYLKYKTKQLGVKIKKPSLLKPSPKKRIKKLLKAFESGIFRAWVQLNSEMQLEKDSTHYGLEFEPDLTALPGWEEADCETRIRILEAAKEYIIQGESNTQRWLGKNTYTRSAMAGFRALYLIYDEDPEYLTDIPSDIWKKWSPIILAYPTGDSEKEEIQKELIKLALKYATKEIVKTLVSLIDEDNEKHNDIFILCKIENCINESIINTLVDKLQDGNLKPKSFKRLISLLIKEQVVEAIEIAQLHISLPIPQEDESRQKSLAAAWALLSNSEDGKWTTIWPVIQNDNEFCKEFLLYIVHDIRDDYEGVFNRLAEGQLTDLYLLIEQVFPKDEDITFVGMHYPTPRENITELKSSIMTYLKTKGTQQACLGIDRIAKQLPDLDWVKRLLIEAQYNMRIKTWVPPLPINVLKVIKDNQTILVQGGEQLLDVLIESLKRLEVKLQGETPKAIDLWNEVKNGENTSYKPKDENRLSDYIKTYLDEDLNSRGIIANREVEIRRGIGGGTGERTDIHVDALRVAPGFGVESFDKLTVIIEVKCCWNQKLNVAMESQLMDRYLKDNHCDYGLYLVGWFNCNQWDETDYRKNQAPQISAVEAQMKFTHQADDLSRHDKLIKSLVINTALR